LVAHRYVFSRRPTFYHQEQIEDEALVAADGELQQVIKAGLIERDQFRGVDREKSIIEGNRHVYPYVYWINDDFRTAMMDACMNREFDPAIINYDGVMEPKNGVLYLKRLLQFLDVYAKNDLLFVGNFVMKSPYHGGDKANGMDVVSRLLQTYIPPDHWHLSRTYYTYDGGATTRSHSVMGSFILVKRGHTELTTVGRRFDDVVIV
jgi:hypothetical protein